MTVNKVTFQMAKEIQKHLKNRKQTQLVTINLQYLILIIISSTNLIAANPKLIWIISLRDKARIVIRVVFRRIFRYSRAIQIRLIIKLHNNRRIRAAANSKVCRFMCSKIGILIAKWTAAAAAAPKKRWKVTPMAAPRDPCYYRTTGSLHRCLNEID